ncbi:hypothetical protein P154DRAFT_153978 [Amniculicola lignicola CBS 123094]|uniref:Uncharacterized protein n=1 Tax=Amniculicola lignicola CBS 123094 TaxID=1392246 RepID=A0A6A5WK73_9PLEO|nr:hypothetical protein P154DRAFT_153978 [Amniculicola lignicola CBS 123094]
MTIRYMCHGFVEENPVPEAPLPQQPADSDDFNNDFSSWIPRYHKPAQPCDYCRSRSLECFIYDVGRNKCCSPCSALFRHCSFGHVNNGSKTALDTLDMINEDSARLFGSLTGKKPMRCLGHVGPIETEENETGQKKGAAAARFPRAAVNVLKTWMIQHIDHPYPTDEEKELLKVQTGLNVGQISNWMANTRRRQKSKPKRSASPSLRPSTRPLDIPPGRTWESLNPFERWKHSPPENEPAPMVAIAKAVETFDPPEPESSSSSFTNRKGNSNGSTGSFSIFRAPSTTSLETGFTNMSSGSLQSQGSAFSHGSKHSFGSLNSLNSKKERRRRRRLPTRTSKADLDNAPRLFQCTFCTDRFKSKYDWSRHEKSLHLSLEKWICAPIGEVITCSSSGQRKCVFCDALDPSPEHLEAHNRKSCEEKGLEARTFYRKDHLRQHLRLMHNCKMLPSMDNWKSEAVFIKSRCGFCAMDFDKWQDRVDHLAKEFRNGATMKDWKGCRGLEAHVASHVMNAMPPYLIANESKSPFPFSATNSSSMKQHNMYLAQDDLEFLIPTDKTSPTSGVFIPHHMGDVSMPDSQCDVSPSSQNRTSISGSSSSRNVYPNPNATCWEILTLRLGRFARQHIEKNGANSLRDEMLQKEARNILYGCDDPWNQTAADNPEWIGLFKKAHGIDTQPYNGTISNHEILEDLGLHPDSVLDPSFNLAQVTCRSDVEKNAANDALSWECMLSGSTNISREAHSISGSASPFTGPKFAAGGIFSGFDNPISELACTIPGGVCIGEAGELGYCVTNGKKSPQQISAFLNSQSSPGKSGDPVGLSDFSIPELPCTRAGDAIQELPCTKAGDFDFSAWDQLQQDFETTVSSAGLDGNIPASASGMRWYDDSELFGLEMDIDMDAAMDQIMGSTNVEFPALNSTTNGQLGKQY